LVAKTLAQAPGAHAVVQADGRNGPWAPGTFDRILLDAPCTGLGVLRRRPEARWRRTPADVAALTDLQTGLLNAAVEALRPGGIVAYVTCSPHIAETDLIVDRALSEHKGAIVECDSKSGLPAGLAATLGSDLRTRLWPHLHDTDGMFAALLRKV
jgi:16S rRNA (cytosine967-C5)-methyltransferase